MIRLSRHNLTALYLAPSAIAAATLAAPAAHAAQIWAWQPVTAAPDVSITYGRLEVSDTAAFVAGGLSYDYFPQATGVLRDPAAPLIRFDLGRDAGNALSLAPVNGGFGRVRATLTLPVATAVPYGVIEAFDADRFVRLTAQSDGLWRVGYADFGCPGSVGFGSGNIPAGCEGATGRFVLADLAPTVIAPFAGNVPAPATLPLMALGSIALGLALRRRA